MLDPHRGCTLYRIFVKLLYFGRHNQHAISAADVYVCCGCCHRVDKSPGCDANRLQRVIKHPPVRDDPRIRPRVSAPGHALRAPVGAVAPSRLSIWEISI